MIQSILDKVIKFGNDLYGRYVARFKKPDEPWYKYYSNLKKIDYPELTIYELIEKTATSYQNYNAYEYFGKKCTYKDFLTNIKKTASALIELGVKENDRVTICMPNTPVAITMFYAVNMIGATACMIHPLSSADEINHYLTISDSKYILTIDLVYNKVIEAIKNTKIKKVIVSSVSDGMSSFKHTLYYFITGKKNKIEKNEKAIFYNELLKLAVALDFERPERKTTDEAVILFSGGTTGKPKGIVLSNMNFNALAMQANAAIEEATVGASILAILPIFHGFGLGVSIHTPLYIGMKVILVPDFTPRKFASLLKKYHPTIITGVPTLYEALIKSSLGKNDLTSLKSVISGGDILTPEFKTSIDDYLAAHGSKAKVRCGYGLTECTGACLLNPSELYKDYSIGIPFPDMKFKIMKLDSNEQADFLEDGEICVSGPTVMQGYLNDPKETKEVLIKDEEGNTWLHTGDIGYMDDDGFVFYKQRRKRLIISSGYNIYPTYVESVINSNKYVDTSIVIGIPHPYKKQVVKAYIVLKKDVKLTGAVKKSIKTYIEKHLVRYSWPYEYEYRDELPKTLVGKVAYKQLEEEHMRKYHEKNKSKKEGK